MIGMKSMAIGSYVVPIVGRDRLGGGIKGLEIKLAQKGVYAQVDGVD